MVNKFLKIVFVGICLFFLGYLSLPNFDFPKPLPGSLQSKEPADTETPLRRAYFTNFTREEVLKWYESQLNKSSFLNLPISTYRLNYPPEESGAIIRDQTKSTFLEEIVHPFRESVYINGFEPKDPKDAIFIENQHWRQKIIIRYVPSSVFTRVIVFIFSAILFVILFKSWVSSLRDIRKTKIRI